MRFTMFKTVKPKQFKYVPRFYNPDKEALEKRKAALGLDSSLNEEEALRSRIHARWKRNQKDSFSDPYKKLSLVIYVGIILTGLYFILFTDIIETFLRAFGVGVKH